MGVESPAYQLALILQAFFLPGHFRRIAPSARRQGKGICLRMAVTSAWVWSEAVQRSG
jgi:hypothetical protein